MWTGLEALGGAGRPASDNSEQEPRITGLVKEGFASLGQHEVRSSGRSGTLPAEMVALGTIKGMAADHGS